MQDKIQTLKDRGDIVRPDLNLGIFDPKFQSKVKKAKSIKHICLGVAESRKEMIENKIKDKWRTYDIQDYNRR